jgi:hypothetical protein
MANKAQRRQKIVYMKGASTGPYPPRDEFGGIEETWLDWAKIRKSPPPTSR